MSFVEGICHVLEIYFISICIALLSGFIHSQEQIKLNAL